MNSSVTARAASKDCEQWILFPVSPVKLIVMSVATFGIYEIYWAIKNWRWLQARTEEKLLPVVNAIFLCITLHLLAKRISQVGQEHGIRHSLPAMRLEIAYALLCLCLKLPDPLWFISFLSVVPVLFVQNYINQLNAKVNPYVPINDKFSVANWVIVIIGLLLMALSLLPEQAIGG
jgi:hypothetical protein